MKKPLAFTLLTFAIVPSYSCTAPSTEVSAARGWCQIDLPIIVSSEQPLDPDFVALARRGEAYGVRQVGSANTAFVVKRANQCTRSVVQFEVVERAYVGSPLEERRDESLATTVCESGSILVNKLVSNLTLQEGRSEVTVEGEVLGLLAGYGVRWPQITGASDRPPGSFNELKTFNDCQYATITLMALETHFHAEQGHDLN